MSYLAGKAETNRVPESYGIVVRALYCRWRGMHLFRLKKMNVGKYVKFRLQVNFNY